MGGPFHDLERALAADPDNPALRLRLAAAYRDAGELSAAARLFHAAAQAFAGVGQARQALGVCRAGLVVAPDHGGLRELLAQLEAPPAPVGASPVLAPIGPRAPARPRPASMMPAVVRIESARVIEVGGGDGDGDLETPLPPAIPHHLAHPTLPVELIAPAAVGALAGAEPAEVAVAEVDAPGGAGLSAAAREISARMRGPSQAEDLAAELETRRRPRVSPPPTLAGPPTDELAALTPASAAQVAFDDEPTGRPAAPAATTPFVRADLEPPALASEPGGHAGEEATDIGVAPGPGQGRADGEADDWPDPVTDLHAEPVGADADAGADPGRPGPARGRSGAETSLFARSFAPVLAELAPDGAPLRVAAAAGASPLPATVSAELYRVGQERVVAAGAVIVREGEPGDSLFVIERGQVRVTRRDAGGAPREMARLGAGAIFGEIAVMSDQVRHATVEALGACTLTEFSGAVVARAAQRAPELAAALDALARERITSNLVLSAPLLTSLPLDRRAQILGRFVPRKVAAGASVLEEGVATHGLYLVVLGQLEVTVRAAGDQRRRVAIVGEGAHLGELALLTQHPARATVTALVPCELAVLSATDFYQVVAEYPALWAMIRAEAESRRAQLDAALAGS
ncbi:MAG: cyclic nucleotide-binding domain-containing protein [Kofleriaceae bacterium]|nr:cyclic nucleotide-binding domain-containing protein [Kofleriaceae bacterium]